MIEEFRDAVQEAHVECARRENISSVVLRESYGSNGNNLLMSYMAAMGTLGGKHAPIQQAQELLMYSPCDAAAFSIIQSGGMIPGWGCAFVKDEPDEVWEEAHAILAFEQHPLLPKIQSITRLLHKQGKNVYPNAACYTACLAIRENIPPELSISLVIEMRASTWRHLLHEHHHQSNQETSWASI